MSIRIQCPNCQAALKSSQAPPAGAAIKCPQCQNTFRFDPQQQPPPLTSPAAQRPQAAAALPRATTESDDDKGSSWPVIIAGFCLLLVICGCGYLMRDQLLALVRSPSADNPGETVAERPVSSGDVGSTTPATNDRSKARRRRESARATPLMSLPAVRQAGTTHSAFAFSSDQTTMACCDYNAIEIWDLKSGDKRNTLTYDYADDDLRLEFSPDGQVLAAVTHTESEWTCHLWLLPEGQEIAQFTWQQEVDGASEITLGHYYRGPIAFAPSSELVAIPGDNGAIVVWDLTRGQPLSELSGHAGRVDDLLFTNDGKKLISASGHYDDPGVRVWSLPAGESTQPIRDQLVFQCLLTADESTLITRGMSDVSLWDFPARTARLKQKKEIADSRGRVALWPDASTLLAVHQGAGVDAPLIQLCELPSVNIKREIQILTDHDNTPLKLSPDGRTIGKLTDEGLILYDAATGQVRANYPHVVDGSEYINTFEFDYTGALLVMSMDNGQLRFEPTTSGAAGAAVFSEALAMLTPEPPTVGVAFSRDGKSLIMTHEFAAINGSDPAISTALADVNKKYIVEQAKWRGASATQRAGLEVDFLLKNAVPALQPIADRNHWNTLATVWDVQAPGKPRRVIRQPYWQRDDFSQYLAEGGPPLNQSLEDKLHPNNGASGTAEYLALADVGDRHLMWVHRTSGFQLTDLQSLQDVSVAKKSVPIQAWRMSPDGRALAAVVNESIDNRRLVLVDLERGTERMSMPLSVGKSHYAGTMLTLHNSIAFSPDGVSFAAVIEQPSPNGSEFVLRVWDVATGREPNPPLGVRLPAMPEYIEFSPNGTLVAAQCAQTPGPQVVDVVAGQLLPTSEDEFTFLPTFSADSQSLTYVTRTALVRIMDLETGQVRTTLQGLTGIVQSLSCSPDGSLLAVAGGDWSTEPGGARFQQSQQRQVASELKLFDAETGELVAILGGHTDLVTQVVFSSDSRLLASWSWDGTARLWDVAKAADANASGAANVRPRPPLAKIHRPAS